MKNCQVQGLPDLPRTVKPKGCQNPRKFSMCPQSLTMDLSVSSEAIRVYLLLALQNYQNGKKTNLATISTRELAQSCGVSHETIRKHLAELTTRGHIEKLGKPRGKATFRLTSPIFLYSSRVETAPNAAADVRSVQLPALRDKKSRCPKCRLVARITSSSGICAGCLAEWVSRTA